MTSVLTHSLRMLSVGGALTTAVLLAPACSGNPAAGLCRDVCNCQSCSDSEEEDCIEAADEALEEAESAGCAEEFDSYVGCQEDAFKCDDERPVFTEDCQSEAEDLTDCGGIIPGTGGVCGQAAIICGADPTQNEVPECTGDVECISQCIVDSNSCDVGSDPDLTDCFNDCTGGGL